MSHNLICLFEIPQHLGREECLHLEAPYSTLDVRWSDVTEVGQSYSGDLYVLIPDRVFIVDPPECYEYFRNLLDVVV